MLPNTNSIPPRQVTSFIQSEHEVKLKSNVYFPGGHWHIDFYLSYFNSLLHFNLIFFIK